MERPWKIGARRQVFGRGVALRQRQQAGALQTLREFGGAVRGRGSAWSSVARCCYETRAGVEPGPLQASRAANDSAYNRPFLQMKGGLPSRPALEERVPPRPMEGHLPRRPLAGVEPGPPWNRYHRAGVEPGLLTGCYHHGWKQGRSGIEREQAAARGEWSSGRGAIWGNTGSGGTIRARIGGRRAGPWGGGGELRAGSVSIPVKRPVGGPGQGGRCVRLGDFPAQRVPAPAVPDSHPAKGCRN